MSDNEDERRDDDEAFYQRRQDRKDAEDRLNREREIHRGHNRIDVLDGKIATARRDEDFRAWKEEFEALAIQMRDSKAACLDTISRFAWAKDRWHEALNAIALTMPEAPSNLAALLSSIHEYSKLRLMSYVSPWSFPLFGIEGQTITNQLDLIDTSVTSLKSDCDRYHRLRTNGGVGGSSD